MKKIHSLLLLLSLAVSLLTACASNERPRASLYDLGMLPEAAGAMPQAAAIRISIAEVNAAAWLDNPAMFYRLSYASDQQPRAYAHNRWVMPPGHLFGQRLKARIAQAGGVAASASDAATNLSVLRIEADDFSHVFASPEQSFGNVSVRASVYNGRTLMAQKTFNARTAAPSNDAAGGTKALAMASDAIIADMMTWLAGLPLKRQ